jgi:hypothetical protein
MAADLVPSRVVLFICSLSLDADSISHFVAAKDEVINE